MTYRDILNFIQRMPERYLDNEVRVCDISINNNPQGREYPVIQIYEDIDNNCDFYYTIDIDSEDWIEGD